ncbi:hypothetical protein [Fuscovulum blasticum]|uniref:hypothetical protein n=1 Tax=Fuscovulum blasticum TaxID=1075 RepID=UPI000F4E0400|nr:hypothetical protein [Fuscovulum blasticum]
MAGQVDHEAELACATTAAQTGPTRRRQIVAALLSSLIAVACLLKITISGRYLPSHEWLRVSNLPAYGLGAVWCFSTVYLMFQANYGEDRKSAEAASPAKFAFMVFGTALFSIIVVDLVRCEFPALIAAVIGGSVEHSYVVVRADERSDKFCRHPIKLKGMPLMKKLCGMPPEFRNQLSARMEVTFIGKGTWMGLYVRDMRPSSSVD